MGRNIASTTARVDAILADFTPMLAHLPREERHALEELLTHARNRRAAIEASSHPDLTASLLLTLLARLQVKTHEQRNPSSPQQRLDRP